MALTRTGGLEVGNAPKLYEIDQGTGMILSSNTLPFSGGSGRVESFGHAGSQLKIGFNTNGGAISNMLGDLSLDGTVSSSVVFGLTPAGHQTDFDTLGGGSGSTIYTSDSNGPFGNSGDDGIYFSLNTDTNTFIAEIAQFTDDGYFNPNDIFVQDGELFSMSAVSDQIRVLDISDGSIVRDVDLILDGRIGNFWGIAPAAIPEPSSFAFLALVAGATGVASNRRRRKASP